MPRGTVDVSGNTALSDVCKKRDSDSVALISATASPRSLVELGDVVQRAQDYARPHARRLVWLGESYGDLDWRNGHSYM
jgi:hypothetical protein